MNRRFDPLLRERMDEVQEVSPELERDLDNLAGLNRHFGGRRIVRHFFRRWFRPGPAIRVLDLATGFGDLPRFLVDLARAAGVAVRVTAIDRQPPILDLARRASDGYPEIEFREGDIREIPPGPPADVILCSLALHHFSDADAAGILGDLAGRFAAGARAVLVADLERSLPSSAGIWLATRTLYRDPMTRHDAAVSARHAFSFRELRALAVASGWHPSGHRRFFPARQAIWMERPSPAAPAARRQFSAGIR